MSKLKYVVLMMAMPVAANAQLYGGDRSGTWDFSIGAFYQAGDSASGDGGSTLDVDDALGIGFNVAYNFNNRFAVGFDFDWAAPDYRAVLIDEFDPNNETIIRHEFSQFNGRLKGILSLSDGPLVPFVEAGVGWTYVDSNIASGPPIVGCWWHPWWGYICDGFYDTFDDTMTSYGGAIGVRYELRGESFIRAGYSYWTLDADDAQAEPVLEAFRIDYGWRF